MPEIDPNQLAADLGVDLATFLERGTGIQTIEEWQKGEGTFFLAPNRSDAHEAARSARKRRKLLQRLAPKAADRIQTGDRADDERHARAILAEVAKDAAPEIKTTKARPRAERLQPRRERNRR